MLNVMCGHDAKDSTSVNMPVPDFEAALSGNIKGKRIGIPKEYRPDGINPEIAAMWDKGIALLRNAGAEIIDISLPHTHYALATYYVIAPAECSSNLARYDGVRFGLRVDAPTTAEMQRATRTAGFGPEVKRRILIGTYVLSAGFYDAYYNRARKVRALIKRDFEQVFAAGIDAILTPAQARRLASTTRTRITGGRSSAAQVDLVERAGGEAVIGQRARRGRSNAMNGDSAYVSLDGRKLEPLLNPPPCIDPGR